MKRKRIYFDFEFTGLTQQTTPISIGCITEDGAKFYAEFTDYDDSAIDDWLQSHVIDNLLIKDSGVYRSKHDVCVKGHEQIIRQELQKWLINTQEWEMWSDCLHYDWVLFCELFGGAMSVPSNIYYIPFDLSTVLKIKNIDPDINREFFAFDDKSTQDLADIQSDFIKDVMSKQGDKQDVKHNALWDAYVIKKCVEKLKV